MNPNEIQDADYPQIWNRPPSGPGTGSGPAQGPTNPTSPERRHTRADSNPPVVVFDATHTRPDTFHGLAGQPPAQSFTNQPQSYTQAPIQQPLLPQAGPGRQAKSDHSIDMDTLGALPGQRPDNQMYVQPDQTPVTARTRRINYGVRTPLKTETSYVALALVILYLVALGFYLYVRVMYSMDMRPYIKGYHIYIFVVECLGITAVLPYALLQVSSTRPTGSPGLPPDDGISIGDKIFNINVLVPCYSESLECIQNTVTAAMDAPIPPGCTKKVWLCDDGNKADKKAFMSKFGSRGGYVTGRKRANPEMNGKSANVNNVLKNYIFNRYQGREKDIPLSEVIVVFDADMCAKPEFFLKILEVLCDDSVALCLTPQAFSNINPNSDIFNNINEQFWEYVLPGCDAWGYIACTGTNFCIRAQALGRCGWFPEYTITEDYALSMALKKKGFTGRYLCEYLAVGEAPDEARNLFRQRSRWTKGHMQIFFSFKHCPLLPFNGLNPAMKWLYTNGTWAYFCNIFTTPTFLVVPFISLMFRIHPVVFSRIFAVAALAYLATNFLIMNYFRKPEHLMGLWLANLSNFILCFTYFKAVINTLLVKMGVKKASGFKVTEKAGGSEEPVQNTMLNRIASMGRTMRQGVGRTMMSIGKQYHAPPPPPTVNPAEKKAKEEKKKKEAMVKTDKIVLMLAFQVCFATIILGCHYIFVYRTAEPHQILPMLWAFYNMVPALIFFVYIFAVDPKEDRFLELTCFWLRYLSTAAAIGAMVCLWFSKTDGSQGVWGL